jgi:hypothetical protein
MWQSPRGQQSENFLHDALVFLQHLIKRTCCVALIVSGMHSGDARHEQRGFPGRRFGHTAEAGRDRYAGFVQQRAFSAIQSGDAQARWSVGIGRPDFFRPACPRVARSQFGEDHAQSQPGEWQGVVRTVSDVPCIAMKDDGGATRGSGCLGHETPERFRCRPSAKSAGNNVLECPPRKPRAACRNY